MPDLPDDAMNQRFPIGSILFAIGLVLMAWSKCDTDRTHRNQQKQLDEQRRMIDAIRERQQEMRK